MTNAEKQAVALRALHLRELYFAEGTPAILRRAVDAQPEHQAESTWNQRFTSRERCWDEDNAELAASKKRGER